MSMVDMMERDGRGRMGMGREKGEEIVLSFGKGASLSVEIVP